MEAGAILSRTAAMCVFLTVGLSAPMGANMVCRLLLASFLLCLRPCCFEPLILTALHVCFKFSLESVILPQALEEGDSRASTPQWLTRRCGVWGFLLSAR